MIEKNCNLKCASCRSDLIWSKEVNPKVEHILNTLVDDYKTFNKDVWFQCDTWGDIFASAAYKNFFRRDDLPKCFQFNLSTNGNLITKNLDLLEKIKSQIFSVIISLDAANPETYKIVRGGKFEIVLDGIKAMKDMGILRINTAFVVQQKNHKEVLDFYHLCRDLGIDYITLNEMVNQPHMTNEWWELNQIRENPTVDYSYLIDALKFIKNDPKVGLCGGLEYIIASKSTSTSN
jgi:MoaA/NifB/PqqE/SkfB family radical SAM enzyme